MADNQQIQYLAVIQYPVQIITLLHIYALLHTCTTVLHNIKVQYLETCITKSIKKT